MNIGSATTTPTSSSSDREPAARRRPRSSRRPAATCSSSRRGRGSSRGRSCRSRSSRWTGSTGRAASPWHSDARRSPTPRADAPGAAPRSTAASTGVRPKRRSLRWSAQQRHRRLRRRRVLLDLRRGGSGTQRVDRAGPPHAGQRAPPRRSRALWGGSHDEIPRWMTYPDGDDADAGQRQSMTRTYLPRAIGGRRPPAVRASRRPAGVGRRSSVPRRVDGFRRRPGHGRLRARVRVRRRDPDTGDPAAVGMSRDSSGGRSRCTRP